MKFKPIAADYAMVVALILFLSCHTITHYLISSYKTTAEELGIAEEIVMMFEGNPFARHILRVESLALIYSYVLMPGLLFGLYALVRKKYEYKPEIINAFVTAIVVMAISNFLNDFSVLLGVLSQ